MRSLFLIFICAVFLPFSSTSQHITDEAGKTYYDNDQTKLKEVYSYKQVTVLNPRTGGEPQKKQVRHGPYFFYYKDGDIKVAGRFKDGDRHGTWEHYSEDGTLQKIVKYKTGKKLEVNEDPEQPGEKPKDREAIEKEMDDS